MSSMNFAFHLYRMRKAKTKIAGTIPFEPVMLIRFGKIELSRTSHIIFLIPNTLVIRSHTRREKRIIIEGADPVGSQA
jgi:hypothetical protein